MQDSTSLIAQNNAPIQQNNIPATAVTNNWQNAEGGIQAQTISNLTVNMPSATSEMMLMLQQLFNGMKPGQTITHAIEWASLSKTHFNIFVLEKEEFNCGMFTIPKTVSLNRYMYTEDIDSFLSLNSAAQDRLKQMPCIFAKRNMQFKHTDPNHPAVLGRITDITVQRDNIRISFAAFQAVPQQMLNEHTTELCLVCASLRNEFDEEHWSVKRGNLTQFLDNLGIVIR